MTDPNEATPKRKTIYRSTSAPGVRSIWDWDEKRQNHIPRRQGLRYQAHIEKNGRFRSSSFRSMEEALEWRNRTRFELEKSPLNEILSFNDLINRFLEFKASRVQISTLESYRSLSKHFAWLNTWMVEDINSHTIDRWLEQVKSESYRAKLRSVRLSFSHEVGLLRIVFSYYREYINEKFENPVRKRHYQDCIIDLQRKKQIEAARRTHYILPTDIEKFLQVFQQQAKEQHEKRCYSVLALIQARTGLRIGEAVALNWQDIDWSLGYLEITKTVQWMRSKNRRTSISNVPKNGRFRRAKFSHEVLNELKQLREQQGRITGLIFSHDGIGIMPYRSIQYHYNGAFKQAGLPWQSTHILRHSFATHFLQVTGNALALKEILGHSELRMTEKYGKVTEEVTQAATEQFEQAVAQCKVLPLKTNMTSQRF